MGVGNVALNHSASRSETERGGLPSSNADCVLRFRAVFLVLSVGGSGVSAMTRVQSAGKLANPAFVGVRRVGFLHLSGFAQRIETSTGEYRIEYSATAIPLF